MSSEDQAFGDPNNPQNQAAFQTHVIDFLRSTHSTPLDAGLVGTKSSFLTGVRALIMTPQKEADAAVDAGDTSEDQDDSVTYIDGINYEDQVYQLMAEVRNILGADTPVEITTYQAINSATDQADGGPDLLFSTFRGHAFFQYGGAEPESGKDLARLFFEDRVVWELKWEEEGPGQPGEDGVARRQEGEAPDVTKVIVGEDVFTLDPTSSVVTVSGVALTLQSNGVVIASQTMNLTQDENEHVFTDQGLTLTLEREAVQTSVEITATVTGTPRSTSSVFSSTSSASSSSSSVFSSTSTALSSSSRVISSTKHSSTFATSKSSPAPTNPDTFPSTVFTIPPRITTAFTTTASNGEVQVTTITGRTNSAGTLVPETTLSPAEATSSASALAAQLSSVSSAVYAFSQNPSDPALATAASDAIHEAQSTANHFGEDLAVALAGLCFAFCTAVASAAVTLGALDAAVLNVVAGVAPVESLGILLVPLGETASNLEDEANPSTTEPTSESCRPTTVTDYQVVCATGIVDGDQTSTTCSTASSLTVASCSAVATAVTSFKGGFCPLHRPSPGPVSVYSYPGFESLPVTTTIRITRASSTAAGTSVTQPIETASTQTASTPTCPPSTQLCDECSGAMVNGQATCRGPSNCPCIPGIDTPGFDCGPQQSCELNGCDGTWENGQATCKNAFRGCQCLPSTDTPGFDCGPQQSCELNGCGGVSNNGEAICTNAFKGCHCLPSTDTPGFDCGAQQSCELNGCDGVSNNGEAICTNAFKGCHCLPSTDTPGFDCGAQQSCELNSCNGVSNNGEAICTDAFKGCHCLPSTDTPGFDCGPQQSCELNGCNGAVDFSGAATCQSAFRGCGCLPSINTPGFSCGNPQPCENNGCNGRGDGAGGATCRDAFRGCACLASAATPGFCGSLVRCSFGGCRGVAVPGQQFGVCQDASHWGCSCTLDAQPPPPPPPEQTGDSWTLRLFSGQQCEARSPSTSEQLGRGPSQCFETFGLYRSWCAPLNRWPASLKVFLYDRESCQGSHLTLDSTNVGCPGEVLGGVGCYEDDLLRSWRVVNWWE